jgi:hypothetical protein
MSISLTPKLLKQNARPFFENMGFMQFTLSDV